jgi:hypothetical protein
VGKCNRVGGVGGLPTVHMVTKVTTPLVGWYNRGKPMESNAINETSPRLDYAAAPSKRRKWLGRGIVLALAIVGTWAGWRWGPYAWKQGRILYWQHQCMTYTAGPEVVAYEEEPGAAAKLLAGGSEYVATPNGQWSPGGSTIVGVASGTVFMPSCWSHFATANGWQPSWNVGSIILTPTPVLAGAGPVPWAIIFLHKRTSPSGHTRLICMRYGPCSDLFNPGFIEDFDYVAGVIIPATMSDPPWPVIRNMDIEVKEYASSIPPKLRIFEGQPDAADASHFTIRYQIWGQEDVVDGYLLDDDSVRISQRNMPIDRPPGRVPR